MSQPVVHFEIAGQDPQRLRDYYGELFGWSFDTTAPVVQAVSEQGQYGFVQPAEGGGIPGGIGGGPDYPNRVLFYVGVDDVEAALTEAERLGGTRTMGPDHARDGVVVVGHFLDPEGHLVGVAAPR